MALVNIKSYEVKRGARSSKALVCQPNAYKFELGLCIAINTMDHIGPNIAPKL